MDRRRFLELAGLSGVAATAGCLGFFDDNNNGTPTPNGTSTPSPTPNGTETNGTDTPNGTETPTNGTETPTETTPTPTPEPPSDEERAAFLERYCHFRPYNAVQGTVRLVGSDIDTEFSGVPTLEIRANRWPDRGETFATAEVPINAPSDGETQDIPFSFDSDEIPSQNIIMYSAVIVGQDQNGNSTSEYVGETDPFNREVATSSEVTQLNPDVLVGERMDEEFTRRTGEGYYLVQYSAQTVNSNVDFDVEKPVYKSVYATYKEQNPSGRQVERNMVTESAELFDGFYDTRDEIASRNGLDDSFGRVEVGLGMIRWLPDIQRLSNPDDGRTRYPPEVLVDGGGSAQDLTVALLTLICDIDAFEFAVGYPSGYVGGGISGGDFSGKSFKVNGTDYYWIEPTRRINIGDAPPELSIFDASPGVEINKNS